VKNKQGMLKNVGRGILDTPRNISDIAGKNMRRV